MKSKLLIFLGIVGMAFSLATVIAPPAQALVCGDPGFVGPCINYKTIDCTTITTPVEKQRCNAMQGCVNKGLAIANCESAWTSCIASYSGNTIDYANCTTAIAGGNLAAAKAPTNADAGKTNCTSMDGLGWIICPALSIVAKVTDAAYASISYMLTVPAIGSNSSGGKDLYKAWSIMRNFANGAFVVAFMIVIYSQLTGAGINNYGIKKLLPRIVIAAILVNVSYWICLIAIDLSNIVGTSIKGVFDGIQGQLYVPPTTTNTVGSVAATTTFGALTALALVADATLIYSMLAFLAPIALTALATIVATIVILTMRDGFIVILIVASPLAFVAYLLPNTQSWFEKWKDFFKILLMMFPLVSFVFGGSALASSILSNVGAGGSGLTPFMMQVMGAGVSVIPLIVVPALIKTASGLLGKYAGYLNDPTKGVFDRMRNRAKEFKGDTDNLRQINALNGKRTLGGNFIRKRAEREAIRAQRDRTLSGTRSGYLADASLSTDVSGGQAVLNAATGGRFGGKTSGDVLLDKMAQGGGSGARNSALAQALTTQQRLANEEVGTAVDTIRALNLTREEKRMLAAGGPVTKNGTTLDASSNLAVQRAGIQSVIASSDIEGINELINRSTDEWSNGAVKDDPKNVTLRQSLADGLASSNNKPAYIGMGKLDEIRQGENKQSFKEIIESAIQANAYSPAKIASTDPDELKAVVEVAANPESGLSSVDRQKLIDSAKLALSDSELRRTLAKNLDMVTHLSNGTSPSTQAAAANSTTPPPKP